MMKSSNMEGLSGQKHSTSDEDQPDVKSEKVLDTEANKTRNNKPKPNK